MQPLVTSRPLQNTHTGIDLSVPEYQEIRGKMLSGHVEYNIVVVTQVAAFKSVKHKPEDIIQFMVSKKYSEIEEFYQKLATRYPQASLPPLPRKVLFVGESDIRERRVAFNEIMRSIAKDTGLATSPELLEFLGTRSSTITDVKGKNLPDKEDEDNEVFDFFKEERPDNVISQFPSSKEQEVKVGKEEEEEEAQEDIDPLGVLKSKKTKKPKPSPIKKDKPTLTIFDEEANPDEGLFGSAKDIRFSSNKRMLAAKENLKLFEDPDLGGVVALGDSLLLPTACASQQQALSTHLEEDTEELLRQQQQQQQQREEELYIAPYQSSLSSKEARQQQQQQQQREGELYIAPYQSSLSSKEARQQQQQREGELYLAPYQSSLSLKEARQQQQQQQQREGELYLAPYQSSLSSKEARQQQQQQLQREGELYIAPYQSSLSSKEARQQQQQQQQREEEL